MKSLQVYSGARARAKIHTNGRVCELDIFMSVCVGGEQMMPVCVKIKNLDVCVCKQEVFSVCAQNDF